MGCGPNMRLLTNTAIALLLWSTASYAKPTPRPGTKAPAFVPDAVKAAFIDRFSLFIEWPVPLDSSEVLRLWLHYIDRSLSAWTPAFTEMRSVIGQIKKEWIGIALSRIQKRNCLVCN